MRKSSIFLVLVFLSSTCYGQTFRVVVIPHGPRLNAVTFFSDSIMVAVGDSGRILRSTNGGDSWVDETPLASHANLYSIARWSNVIAGQNGTILRSTDQGINWEPIRGPTGGFTLVRFLDTSHGLLANPLYESLDSGTNWLQKTGSPGLPSIIQDIAMLSDSTWIAVVNFGKSGAGTIFRTTNAGNDWSIGAVVPDGGPLGAMWAIPSKLYTAGGESGFGGIILSSLDSGNTWSDTTFVSGLLRSIAGIDSDMAVAVGDSGALFIHSLGDWYRGVSGTFDQLRSVAVNAMGNSVAVGGDSLGVIIKGSATSSVGRSHSVTGGISAILYPNPASRAIKVAISLPTSEALRVSLVGSTGVVIANFHTFLNSGAQRLTIDVSHLPADSYFLQLSSPVEQLTLPFQRR